MLYIADLGSYLYNFAKYLHSLNLMKKSSCAFPSSVSVFSKDAPKNFWLLLYCIETIVHLKFWGDLRCVILSFESVDFQLDSLVVYKGDFGLTYCWLVSFDIFTNKVCDYWTKFQALGTLFANYIFFDFLFRSRVTAQNLFVSAVQNAADLLPCS